MRKVDAETYRPVEEAETMEVEFSRTHVTTFLQGATVFVVVFVLLWWFLSRDSS